MSVVTPAIATRGLTKVFGSVRALDGLDLEVPPGEVLALLGANGSGKSTTFRLLLNIYHPTSGVSALLGCPSRKLNTDCLQHVGYISEGQRLPLWMTVAQYIDYCAGFYPQWDDGMVGQLVKAFGLPMDGKLKHLSRGQRMKAAVTSVLPAHPKLLLLDEPFSGLDVETRAQLSYLLRNLAKEDGLATVITTHDVEEVEPVASRILILDKGRKRIDEQLAAYLARHRYVDLHELAYEALPEAARGKIHRKASLTEPELIFTDQYSPEFESDMADVTFRPMTLRQILTAHAISLL